jgi:hypothetical protein
MRLNEPQRRRLRTLVDAAKRSKLAAENHVTVSLRLRSPAEVKRQTAARKAILAACRWHDENGPTFAVVAGSGDLYLVSVGGGYARTVDVGTEPPFLSEVDDVHALLGSDVDWVPFAGDPAAILDVVEAAAGSA